MSGNYLKHHILLMIRWKKGDSSKWLNMNVLSIDENKVIVEKKEKPLIDILEKLMDLRL